MRPMSPVHREPFTVRFYECDAFGHLATVAYLRWMQEAAFRASAALGYGTARYAELGCLWLIRETDIAYLHPLRYGTEVEVSTWVADIRRSHSVRRYEFVHAATRELIAHAATDWALVDDRTLRPIPVPEVMLTAFWPDGHPDPAEPRERLPRGDCRAPADGEVRADVVWRDVDTMWHVNNAVYLEYVENATAEVCGARGWPMNRVRDAGCRLTARRHRIEYRLPAQLGDELRIAVWWTGGDVPGTWRYEIRRAADGALLARARTTWAWVDLATGAPCERSIGPERGDRGAR
jgi:acyl-CoA thioester hydrolase